MVKTQRTRTFLIGCSVVNCLAILLAAPGWAAAQSRFSGIVVFGTSLSDPGNAFVLVGDQGTPPDFMLNPLLIPSVPYAKGGHHFSNGATWVEQYREVGWPGRQRPGRRWRRPIRRPPISRSAPPGRTTMASTSTSRGRWTRSCCAPAAWHRPRRSTSSRWAAMTSAMPSRSTQAAATAVPSFRQPRLDRGEHPAVVRGGREGVSRLGGSGRRADARHSLARPGRGRAGDQR